MATRILAPSMGEGIEELTIVTWLKKEGDAVKEFEVVVELETDKVSTEIPSPEAGTLLKILAQKDEVVKVGSTLAWIGKPGEALEGVAPTAKAVVSAEAVKPAESAVTAAAAPAVETVVPCRGKTCCTCCHGSGCNCPSGAGIHRSIVATGKETCRRE